MTTRTALLLGFFACSLVAISKRWSRGPAHSTPFDPGATTAAPAPTGRTATVVFRPPHTSATMRAGPAISATVVTYLSLGTVVEVGSSRTVQQGRTPAEIWYPTRAVVGSAVYEGWMHQNVLRMQ